jgi:hypothetical protein
MQHISGFELEVISIILAWVGGVVFLSSKAKHSGFMPLRHEDNDIDADKIFARRKIRDISFIISSAAATLVGLLYALRIGTWQYLLDFLGAGMLLGFAVGSAIAKQIRLEKEISGAQHTAEPHTNEHTLRLKSGRKRNRLIYVGGVGGLGTVCIWYYIHGLPPHRILLVAIIVFLVFNVLFWSMLSNGKRSGR